MREADRCAHEVAVLIVQATFIKRKNGLFKKAMELSILCGCEIALIVFNSSKLFHYSSSDLDSTLVKYADFNDDANQAITNKEVCEPL